MAQAWRLVREQYAGTAFTGEGAAKFGGRWNSRGKRIVYTSSTLSLAALETLVHLNPPVAIRYVAFQLNFHDKMIQVIDTARLTSDWQAQPPGTASMAIGDDWVRQAKTAVLAVPSVLVPGEVNYLLNPAHVDFAKIKIGKPKPFAFDPRLI